MSLPILVLTGKGLNTENEFAYSFKKVGARPEIVQITDLLASPEAIHDYKGFAIPGGFSYGDHIRSGVVMAADFRYTDLGKELKEFVGDGKPVMGVCNGFQVLVETGLLPNATFKAQAALARNKSKKFVDRWVTVDFPESASGITRGLQPMHLPVRHGEGRFTTSEDVHKAMEEQRLVAVRYIEGTNPNGSRYDIAGVTNPEGNVLGMMPHPEAFHSLTNHPEWTRVKSIVGRIDEPRKLAEEEYTKMTRHLDVLRGPVSVRDLESEQFWKGDGLRIIENFALYAATVA